MLSYDILFGVPCHHRTSRVSKYLKVPLQAHASLQLYMEEYFIFPNKMVAKFNWDGFAGCLHFFPTSKFS